jgi:hypothetical protein
VARCTRTADSAAGARGAVAIIANRHGELLLHLRDDLPHIAWLRRSFTGQPLLEVEFQMFDVGELDLQAVGAAAVVGEVDLAGCFGGEVLELLFGGVDGLGVEEAGRVVRTQAGVRWRRRASSGLPGRR